MTDMVTDVSISKAPTDRSISPIEMTKTIPTAMIPIYEDCRSTETRLFSVRNVSVSRVNARQMPSMAAMTPD